MLSTTIASNYALCVFHGEKKVWSETLVRGHRTDDRVVGIESEQALQGSCTDGGVVCFDAAYFDFPRPFGCDSAQQWKKVFALEIWRHLADVVESDEEWGFRRKQMPQGRR